MITDNQDKNTKSDSLRLLYTLSVVLYSLDWQEVSTYPYDADGRKNMNKTNLENILQNRKDKSWIKGKHLAEKQLKSKVRQHEALLGKWDLNFHNVYETMLYYIHSQK